MKWIIIDCETLIYVYDSQTADQSSKDHVNGVKEKNIQKSLKN